MKSLGSVIGKINYHCDRLEEFEMFKPPPKVAEGPTEKNDRWFWSRRFFYCSIALFCILFCIFIVIINGPTGQTLPSTSTPLPSPSSELKWSKNGPIYVINIAPLLSPIGLNEKIEYMQKLGVKYVVLSSENADIKVIDHSNLNSSFGNINGMKNLIEKIKKQGMKVMLKLIPNHSSSTKFLFEQSALKKKIYKNYYIWNPGYMNGTHRIPINNWLNVNGKCAWKWNKIRKEFYLHQFLEEEPDLNFRNKHIVDYFEGALSFWLRNGVDGFYLDKVKYLFEDKTFKNNTYTLVQSVMGDSFNSSGNKATSNLPETKKLLSKWGMLIKNYSGILIVSDIDNKKLKGVNIVHSPIKLASNFTAQQLFISIISKSTPFPSWEWVCADGPNCWKNEIIDAFSILGSLLPGTSFINADPKLFEDGNIPNITLIEHVLKELRSTITIKSSSFKANLLSNNTVLTFNRVMSNTSNILFVWNLSQNTITLNLYSFDGVLVKANLTLCTLSACSILPPIKSKVDVQNLNLAAKSAVVLTY